MAQPKRDEEEHLWIEPTQKYHEVHEELNRRKKEDKTLEEALFQVVTQQKVPRSFSENEAVRRKQSIKKLFGFLKFRKNKR